MVDAVCVGTGAVRAGVERHRGCTPTTQTPACVEVGAVMRARTWMCASGILVLGFGTFTAPGALHAQTTESQPLPPVNVTPPPRPAEAPHVTRPAPTPRRVVRRSVPTRAPPPHTTAAAPGPAAAAPAAPTEV